MIRVLVVDDSAAMRGLIAAALHRDPDISVVGQAANPFEARDAIKALNPDVLTLDVEMPGMTGLDFLEKIMRLRPMPVIMVSTRTAHGTEATLQALELGAVDCVAKPNSASPDSFDTLPVKIHEAARARIRPLPRHALATAPTPSPAAADYRPDGRLLAIGASTGGVEALITVLSHLPANGPPTVITQHMPENFTRSFAARLDRICAATVAEGSDGAVLTQGRVYLAPGGSAHLEVVNNRPWQCRLREAAPVNGHRPSVDVLFASVAAAAGPRAVGVILTGMGRDGAQGLLAMREAGAATLGQDEATSVVYGMPRVAFEMAAVQRQMPLERIGAEIVRMTHAQARRDG